MESNLAKSTCQVEDALDMAKFRAEEIQTLMDSGKEFFSICSQMSLNGDSTLASQILNEISQIVQSLEFKLQTFKDLVSEIQDSSKSIENFSEIIQRFDSEIKRVLGQIANNDDGFKEKFKKLAFDKRVINEEVLEKQGNYERLNEEIEEIKQEIGFIDRFVKGKKREIDGMKMEREKEDLVRRKEEQELEILRLRFRGEDGQRLDWDRGNGINFESFRKNELSDRDIGRGVLDRKEVDYRKTYLLSFVLILVLALLTTTEI